MFAPRNFPIKPKYSTSLASQIKDEKDPITVVIETEPNLTEAQLLKLDYYGVDITEYDTATPLIAELSLDKIDAIVELVFIKRLDIPEEKT